MKILFLIIFTLFIGGCGTTPLSRLDEPHTARTLGKGNSEVGFQLGLAHSNLSNGNPIFPVGSFGSIEYKRGIFNNFDLAGFSGLNGVASEVLFIGLEGKYQLFHNDSHSFSIFLGGGTESR